MQKIILKNGTTCFFGNRKETEAAQKFDYMMLSRLKMDMETYFNKGGFGYLVEKHLWAGNIKDQINKMTYLFNKIYIKPEWLTIEQLNEYTKKAIS